MHQSTWKSFGDASEMHQKSMEFDTQGCTLTHLPFHHACHHCIMEYVFNVCTLYSLLPSVPYAAVLFYIAFMAFHCSKAGWANNYSWLPSSSQQNSFASILLHPGMAGGASACLR